MPDVSDHDLLQNYSRRASEEAFAELVRRHVNLVYSAAFRHVGIAAQAEEITQAVFVILAQKGAGLHRNIVLEAWLYQTTRLTSLSFLRAERRRQIREQEAYMQSKLQETTDTQSWNQLAPLLDEAMGRLDEKDREAVVLRFFKEKSLGEVAAALRITEAAAQSRVHRAVEKLHESFLGRGINSTTEAITEAISAHSVQMAPLALAKSATAIALSKGVTVSTSSSSLANGTLKLMAWTKIRMAPMAAAVVVTAGAVTTMVIAEMPTSAGSTSRQSAEVTADRTTPRGTLLVMANALLSGDAKAYVGTCVFTSPDELKLKGILEQFVAADAKFVKAVADRFGAGQANDIKHNMPLAIPADLIKNATEKIDGDSATVDFLKGMAKGAKTRPIQFTKVDGEWKLKGFGLMPVDAAILNNIFPRLIGAINDGASAVAQGKYKSAAEALQAVKDSGDY